MARSERVGSRNCAPQRSLNLHRQSEELTPSPLQMATVSENGPRKAGYLRSKEHVMYQCEVVLLCDPSGNRVINRFLSMRQGLLDADWLANAARVGTAA